MSGGMFTQLRKEAESDKIIVEFNNRIVRKESELDRIVQEYAKEIEAIFNIGHSIKDRNKRVVQVFGNTLASGLTFFTGWGPLAAAFATGSILKYGAGSKMAIGGFSSLFKYNATVMNRQAMGGRADGSSYADGISQIIGMAGKQNIIGINAAFLTLDPYERLLDKQKVRNAKYIKSIPLTTDARDIALAAYSTFIKEGLLWVDVARERRSELSLLCLYKIVSEVDVGGRGNHLMSTGVMSEYSLTFGKELYSTLAEAISRVETLENNAKALIGKKSRLVDVLLKYKESNYATSYDHIFYKSRDTEEGRLGGSVITAICLEKSRVIAYSEDYSKALKGGMGNYLQKTQETFKRIHKGLKLPEFFFAKDGNFHKSVHSSLGISTVSASDQRVDYTLGVYAFHLVLERHLGTFNLGSLLPYGIDDNQDRAVKLALIDALATQWWITSRAYDSAGKITKSLNTESQVFKDNMLDDKAILSMPYIKCYFDPERTWKAIGSKFFVKIASLVDLKTRLEESNELEAANKLGKQKTANTLKAIKSKIEQNINIELHRNYINVKDGFTQKNESENLADLLLKLQEAIASLTKVINNLELSQNDTALVKNIANLANQNDAANSLIKNIKDGLDIQSLMEFVSTSNNKKIAIDDKFIVNLMPLTGKTSSTTNPISDQIGKILHKVYHEIIIADDVAFKHMCRGYGIISTEQNTSYIEDAYEVVRFDDDLVERKYDSAYGNGAKFKTPAEFKTKYLGLLGAKPNLRKNLVDLVEQNQDNISDKEILKSKLADSLAKIHMGALASAKNVKEFNQADFNREVARSLKAMAQLLKDV